MIPLFVDGTLNVLKHYGVIPGPIGRTAFDANVMIGFHRMADQNHRQREGSSNAGDSAQCLW
jgi:hypothetical protein